MQNDNKNQIEHDIQQDIKDIQQDTKNTPAAHGGTKRAKALETLCWTCQHCTCAQTDAFRSLDKPTPSGAVSKQFVCPWTQSFTPVPGWTARKTRLKTTTGEMTESYLVEACPFYKADLEGQADSMDREKLKRLLGLPSRFVRCHMTLVKQLAISYIKACQEFTSKHKAKPNRAQRFKIRKAVIKMYRYYNECDIEEILKDESSSDDARESAAREIRVLKAEIKACDTALKSLKRIENSGYSVVGASK